MTFDLKQFFDRSPDLFCILSTELRFIELNESWSKVLGYSREEMLGRQLTEFVHPDDRSGAINYYDRVRQGKPAGLFDIRYIKKDGSITWIRRNGVFAKDLDVYFVVARDISNLIQAQSLAEFYRDAIDQADIVSMTDASGRITYANDLFCQVSGYSREELIGKPHSIVKSGIISDSAFAEMWQTISSGKVWRGEICNRAKNGALYWVDSVIVPLRDSSGRPESYISIRRDITDRKNLEKQIRDSDKMAALGQMASGIAHEINNPLAVLLAKIEQLKARVEREPSLDIEKLEQDLDKLLTNCNRIAKIVKGMRSFARDGTNDPMENARLKDIFVDLQEISRAKLKALSIPLVFDSFPESLELQCRPSQILQILVNLVNNAADAIEGLKDRWIKVGVFDGGGHLDLWVTDSGKGIPPESRARLFEAFYTTKAGNRGTGLGLNISRKIAEQHGGALVLDENSSQTRFVLTLPKAQKT